MPGAGPFGAAASAAVAGVVAAADIASAAAVTAFAAASRVIVMAGPPPHPLYRQGAGEGLNHPHAVPHAPSRRPGKTLTSLNDNLQNEKVCNHSTQFRLGRDSLTTKWF